MCAPVPVPPDRLPTSNGLGSQRNGHEAVDRLRSERWPVGAGLGSQRNGHEAVDRLRSERWPVGAGHNLPCQAAPVVHSGPEIR